MVTSVYTNKTFSEPSIFPCGTTSRRMAIKVWFHHTLLREEYDDQFRNNECISVNDLDDLSLVPSFKRSTADTMQLSNKAGSPDIAETYPLEAKNANVKSHRLRKFKNRFKSKFRSFKHGTAEKKQQTVKFAGVSKSSVSEDKVEWFKLFGDISNNLETLFDDELNKEFDGNLNEIRNTNSTYVRENEIVQKLGLTQQVHSTNDHPRPYSHDEEHDTVIKHSLDRSMGSVKRNSSDEAFENTIRKRQCPENVEDRKINSVENSQLSHLEQASGTSDSESGEKTPPIYLARPKDTNENKDKNGEGLGETVDSLKIIAAGVKKTSDKYCCHDTNYRKSVSSDSNSSANVVKVFTIPTFRSKNKSANITTMIKEIESKKLDSKQLSMLAQTGSIGREELTFQDKRFYEDVPQDSNENDSNNGTERVSEERKKNFDQKIENTDGRVAFDQYSFLVVYKPSRKCQSSNENVKFLSEEVSYRPRSLRIQQHMSHLAQKPETRSILKTRPNSKEQEEIKRAINCDKVDVGSFLDYFEKFESKRQSEGSKLGEFRDRQLNHYYSELFFPELLQSWKKNESIDTEYTKSRKATELNIGRKFDGIKCSIVHYTNNEGTK